MTLDLWGTKEKGEGKSAPIGGDRTTGCKSKAPRASGKKRTQAGSDSSVTLNLWPAKAVDQTGRRRKSTEGRGKFRDPKKVWGG